MYNISYLLILASSFAKNESAQNCPAWSAKMLLDLPEYFAAINKPIAPI